MKNGSVDGVEATTDNVKSGSYKVARPFNVAVKSDASDAAKEFMDIDAGNGWKMGQ